jgi:hypothetical protein
VARLLVKADALRNPAALRLQDAGQGTCFVRVALAQSVPASAKTQTLVRVDAFVLRSNLIFSRPL